MRILLISGSLPPMKCGVGDYTANLASALSLCDHNTVAVLTDVAAAEVPREFRFQVLPIARGWKMRDVSCILRAALDWRPDVIHIQYPAQGYGHRYLPWLLPIFFRLSHVPIVQTWHEYYSNSGRRRYLNAAIGDGLIAVRPDYKANMPRWFRWLIRGKHFEFIPNASAIPKVSLTDAERLAVKSQLTHSDAKLVVFFGFVYPAKRVELVFEIADPGEHYVLLIADLNPSDPYHRTILELIQREPWNGRAAVTGFLPPSDVAKTLAAADAVLFPFRDGAGLWNTSVHAAAVQGTFVLTTSLNGTGYDAPRNIYLSDPNNLLEMRSALRTFEGRRITGTKQNPADDWRDIAKAHQALYQTVLSPSHG